ncbi:hypothetical protein HK101_008292 [Irineochytrium annulatum]|nr:hypothetical protein HK101_008292 [Irineochytrium annulatum]
MASDAPPAIRDLEPDEELEEVEAVMDIKVEAGRTQYLLKWRGSLELSWVPKEDAENIDGLIEEYYSRENDKKKRAKKDVPVVPSPASSSSAVLPSKRSRKSNPNYSEMTDDEDELEEDELASDRDDRMPGVRPAVVKSAAGAAPAAIFAPVVAAAPVIAPAPTVSQPPVATPHPPPPAQKAVPIPTPASPAIDPAAPVKRKRGRPPKVRPVAPIAPPVPAVPVNRGTPVKIVRKSQERSGRIVYQVLWTNGDKTMEPLDSTCCENWVDMIEDFEHMDVAPSPPPPPAPVVVAEKRKRGRKPKVVQAPVVVEEEDYEEEYEEEEEDVPVKRRKAQVDSDSDENDELDPGSPGRRVAVMYADYTEKSTTPHHDVCNRCGMKSESKRHKKKTGGGEDLVGDLGELMNCVTCSAAYHPGCHQKPVLKKAKDRLRDIHATSDYLVEGFQCSLCIEAVLPHCFICDGLPNVDPVVEVEVPDPNPPPAPAVTDLAEGEEPPPPPPIPMVKKMKVEVANINPLFRCIRCSFYAHVPCLLREFKECKPVEEGADPESRNLTFGTVNHYLHAFECNDCVKWRSDLEGIVTYRDLKVDGVPRFRKVLYQDRRREYFVKFQNLSQRACAWVPESWLTGLQGGVNMIRRFDRKYPGPPLPPLECFPEDLIRVDKILDVEYHSGQDDAFKDLTGSIDEMDLLEAAIAKVETVLVKWKGSSFENTTWETIPTVKEVSMMDAELVIGNEGDARFREELECGMRPSFMEALRHYILRQRVGTEVIKANFSDPRPAFVELERQPEFVMNGTLKGYQMEGLNWLLYKWTKSIPCILADEMGLGKTVQIVSFINCLFKNHNVFPFVIAAPIITTGHWIKEFAHWAPDLIVVLYSGNKNDRDSIREHLLLNDRDGESKRSVRFHVLLSGYETLMAESSLFKDIPFRALICDEGHRLKNDQAKTFRSFVDNIDAEHKIIMTGTPLQNNLRELFSLLNFLDPGNWADPKELEVQYENISDQKIVKIHEDLKPYFLRRTKNQVLGGGELPPKAELLVPCSLTSLQKQLYRAVLSKNFKVLKSIGEKSSDNRVSPLHNILVELRKICDHPYLLKDVEPLNLTPDQAHSYLTNASGKLILLQPLLSKLKQRGHRVLIFSQFKIALNILEDFLRGEGHLFLRIDGESKMETRQGLLDAFNAPGSDYFVFLLTTRTGGVGINLTSADTIIMYDADWNPHQDIQAMARVHRIGQKKPVLIFKLFTRGAVEERIIEMGKKKLVLDHLIVEKMVDENVDSREISEIIKFGAESMFQADDTAQQVRYDDAEIEKLLQRDEIIAEQQQKEKLELGESVEGEEGKGVKNSFAFARVWTLEKEEVLPSADEVAVLLEEVAKESVERGGAKAQESKVRMATISSSKAGDMMMGEENDGEVKEEDTEFWDRLLKNRIEEAAKEEKRRLMMDTGKRTRTSRKTINYSDSVRRVPGGKNKMAKAAAAAAAAMEDDNYEEDEELIEPAEDYGDDDYTGEDQAVKEPSEDAYAGLDEGEPEDAVVEPREREPSASKRFSLPPNLEPTQSRAMSGAVCFMCNRKGCRFKSQCPKGAEPAALTKMQRTHTKCMKSEPDNGIWPARFKIVQRLLSRLEKLDEQEIVIEVAGGKGKKGTMVSVRAQPKSAKTPGTGIPAELIKVLL